MVKNEPNFKTHEVTKCTKVLKMLIIVKLPQSDQNLTLGFVMSQQHDLKDSVVTEKDRSVGSISIHFWKVLCTGFTIIPKSPPYVPQVKSYCV